MLRSLVTLLLAGTCVAQASIVGAQVHASNPGRALHSSTSISRTRRLLNQPTQQRPISGTPGAKTGATTSSSSSSSQTCCNCKCVIPAKDMRSPACKASPGCVGMGAPSYSQKNICAPGANRSCDGVCMRDMGSWKALHEC